MSSKRGFKLALIQMLVGSDKSANLKKAIAKIAEAAENGANVVVLPKIPGPTTEALEKVAGKHHIYLIGGSLPEEDNGKLYNTCPLINSAGKMVAKFRKIHLFDIDVPGGIRFQESETLSAGQEPIVFRTEYCDIGIGICYDIRFNELAKLYSKLNCELLVYPGAFNMTTGPVHWELLAKSRSLDNQAYTALCSPARNPDGSYVAWGHSMVNDPWGKTVASTKEQEDTIYADIDLDYVTKVRQMVPISSQRRSDIYDTVGETRIVS